VAGGKSYAGESLPVQSVAVPSRASMAEVANHNFRGRGSESVAGVSGPCADTAPRYADSAHEIGAVCEACLHRRTLTVRRCVTACSVSSMRVSVWWAWSPFSG